MRQSGIALLTGGTGFIGRRVVRRLIADGWTVRILSKSGAHHRIAEDESQVEWYCLKDEEIAKATEGVTHYFNFAVVYDRPEISEEMICQVNVDLPRRVIEHLQNRGDRPVCVLGDSFFRKFPPNATAQSRYTRSKTAQWEMAQEQVRGGKIAAAMLRIEQVYGPGDVLTKVLPSIVLRMLRQDERIPLTSGAQCRDFIHVDDVVEAAVVVAKRHKLGATVIDCGCGNEISIREVFQRLKVLTGSNSILGFGDLPQDQSIVCSKADIEWLTNEGWKPKISLNEGLTQLIEDVRSRF